jgi:hypothetical protein
MTGGDVGKSGAGHLLQFDVDFDFPSMGSRNPNMLLQEDQWVGEAITSARIAYECWTGLVNGEFIIVP